MTGALTLPRAALQEKFRLPDGFVPFQYTMLSGLISGGTAAYLSTPFDVVKTKIQRSYTTKLTIVPTFKKTLADGGLAALFVGGPQRVMIIAPLFGITLMSYEIQKWLITKYFSD
jgi:solute carrier family 25 glutamate transporter 18/22